LGLIDIFVPRTIDMNRVSILEVFKSILKIVLFLGDVQDINQILVGKYELGLTDPVIGLHLGNIRSVFAQKIVIVYGKNVF